MKTLILPLLIICSAVSYADVSYEGRPRSRLLLRDGLKEMNKAERYEILKEDNLKVLSFVYENHETTINSIINSLLINISNLHGSNSSKRSLIRSYNSILRDNFQCKIEHPTEYESRIETLKSNNLEYATMLVKDIENYQSITNKQNIICKELTDKYDSIPIEDIIRFEGLGIFNSRYKNQADTVWKYETEQRIKLLEERIKQLEEELKNNKR